MTEAAALDVEGALRRVDDALWQAERARAAATTVQTTDLHLLMRFCATLARRHREHISPAAREAEAFAQTVETARRSLHIPRRPDGSLLPEPPYK